LPGAHWVAVRFLRQLSVARADDSDWATVENTVTGVFTPVLAKHTKSFNLVDTLSVGVDRIQRNFEPMQRQVETWRQTQITDTQAKLIFYSAFVDGKLDAPKSLLPDVHRLYFEPEYPEFSQRTMWSLSNAFTSAFKKLDPVPQFKSPLFETKITLPSAYFDSKSLFRHTKSISRPLELVSRTKQGREFVGDFIRVARRLLEETLKVPTRPYGRRPLE
jgi:hypothetical protein